MAGWRFLDRTRAHVFYHLPLAITQHAPNALFIPDPYPIDIDGPWSLVLVVRDTATAPTFHLTFCTVYEETLERSSNPLDWETGYLLLDRSRTLALATLIRDQSLLTSPQAIPLGASAFERLSEDEAQSFRFDLESLPDTIQHFYRVHDNNQDSTTTILSWGYRQAAPRRKVHIAITAIPPATRSDDTWFADDHPTGTLCLNRWSGLELAALLESYGVLLDP